MLLSSLSLNPQSIEAYSNLIPAQAGASNKNEDLEEDTITDPKLLLQKRLIDVLFSQKQNEEKGVSSEENDDKKRDSVIISKEALELFQRESASFRYESDSEQLEVTYERIEYFRIERTGANPAEPQVQQAEPLVIDLNNNGLELTDVRADQQVKFDITGDGIKESVSWVKPSDGLLVFDRNGNHSIDSGKELFGDQNGAANGFEELAKFDATGDGVINSDDEIYQDLKIWRDLNQNGYSEKNELGSISDYGIQSIDLNKDNTSEYISGNRVEGYSNYKTANSTGKVGEVFFNYLA